MENVVADNIITKELKICWHFQDDNKHNLTKWEDNYDCIRKIIHILYPDAQLIPIQHIDNCDTQIWQIVVKEVGKTIRTGIAGCGLYGLTTIANNNNIQINSNNNNNTYVISKEDFKTNKLEENILNGSAKDLKERLPEEQYIQIQQCKNKFSKLAKEENSTSVSVNGNIGKTEGYCDTTNEDEYCDKDIKDKRLKPKDLYVDKIKLKVNKNGKCFIDNEEQDKLEKLEEYQKIMAEFGKESVKKYQERKKRKEEKRVKKDKSTDKGFYFDGSLFKK